MIFKLKMWCEGLIIAVLISVIIEIMIPEGSNKKYAKVIIGIYILYIIITPALELFNEKIDFNFFSKYKFEETSADLNNDIKDIYVIGIEEKIKEELINNGIDVDKVDVIVDYKYENIEKIIIESKSKINKEELINYFMENYSIDNIEIRSKYD